MKSIFLSHTSIDKPFVEKLAKDLQRLGLNVWYDKWSIQTGESLTWKIEEGIRENEFWGIVLSPEALRSEWVKAEIGSAWVKQMSIKKVIILPILYRDCNIPFFLSDRKYADFRTDYNLGFKTLVGAFGIKQTETISIDNWRLFVKRKNIDWKFYRQKEFENLVTTLINNANEYRWSAYVGGTSNPFSITLFVNHKGQSIYISFKLKSQNNGYWVSLSETHNPNHLKPKDYIYYIGNSINACSEYLWRHMEDFTKQYGIPVSTPVYYTYRFPPASEIIEKVMNAIKETYWYKGNKYLDLS